MDGIIWDEHPPTGSGVQRIRRERIRVHGNPHSGGDADEYRVWWRNKIELLTADRGEALERLDLLRAGRGPDWAAEEQARRRSPCTT